jgi:hypothetical protein
VGTPDDASVWATLRFAHAAFNAEAPLSQYHTELLQVHLHGASSCVQDLADRAFTNQAALCGRDLDSLIKRHAVGTQGVPAGVLRRFLAASDLGTALTTEVRKAFTDAVDKVGCPWSSILNALALARDEKLVFCEAVKRKRRSQAAARRRKRKRVDPGSNPAESDSGSGSGSDSDSGSDHSGSGSDGEEHGARGPPPAA